MEPTTTLAGILLAAKVVGAFATLGTAVFGVFRVITWIKNKLTNIDSNVVKLKESMDSHITGLRSDIKDQTATIVTAFSEQRSDFRTFYGPTLMLMQQQQALQTPVRAKRSVRKPAQRKKGLTK